MITHKYVNGVSIGISIIDGLKQGHPQGDAPPIQRDTLQHSSMGGASPCGCPCPTLVLLHGFTGSAASWGRHLETFASYGFHVIALDMLGHGQSDAPQDARRYTIEAVSG